MEYILLGIFIAIGFYIAPVFIGLVFIIFGAIVSIIANILLAIFDGKDKRSE